MTLQEFKGFLETYISRKQMYFNREHYMPVTFQQTLINSILVDMAFNPMNTGDWLNRFLEKYLSDSDVACCWLFGGCPGSQRRRRRILAPR
jgi:hypothetical protein